MQLHRMSLLEHIGKGSISSPRPLGYFRTSGRIRTAYELKYESSDSPDARCKPDSNNKTHFSSPEQHLDIN